MLRETLLSRPSLSPRHGQDDHHRDDKGRTTLTVVGKNPENKVLDLGAQGPTQGDMRVVNALLYDKSGKERIGRFDLFCAITDPADESSEKSHMAQCTKTFTLPGGQISVQGVEAYPNLSGLAQSPGLLLFPHSRATWKMISAKSAFHDFSEVAPTFLTLHTGHVDQLEAGPTGPALS
jgi:hypothetical protein